MDGLPEVVEMLQAEAASYPYAVRIWMRVMAVSFFFGVVFTPWRSGARWVVGAMALTAAGLIVGKALLPEISRELIGTVLHLSLWPILLFVVWRPPARRERRETLKKRFDGVYQVWLVWVSTLIIVSLILDVRNVLASIG